MRVKLMNLFHLPSLSQNNYVTQYFGSSIGKCIILDIILTIFFAPSTSFDGLLTSLYSLCDLEPP